MQFILSINLYLLTAEKGGKVTKMSLTTFLDMDLNHKIIKSINLPELDDSYHVRTFKVI